MTTKTPTNTPPLVSVKVTRDSDECPFLNKELSFSLAPGEIMWLRGASGAGKSLTCYALAGLSTGMPGARLDAVWDESVPASERIGFLFQKGVLVDALNLAENIALSLRASGQPHPPEAIDAALEAVGLSGSSDGSKMPGEVRGTHHTPPSHELSHRISPLPLACAAFRRHASSRGFSSDPCPT